MACFRPLYGWQRQPGEPLRFGAERKDHRRVEIPCGYCVGCRLARARNWAIRCMHEVHLSPRNCFVTLTYKNAKTGLEYRDFQNFMRVLRRRLGYLDVTRWVWLPRYFACGEYGEQNDRPHWHAILFGIDFMDRVPFGTNTWRSPTLEKIWTHGYSTIGEANFQTAGYVARYSLKKVYGPRAVEHYKRLDTTTGEILEIAPEMAHMSLKPGIGREWLEKYWQECYAARDGIVLKGGSKIPTPRYYDKWLRENNHDLAEWRESTRYKELRLNDCTAERLAVREQAKIGELKFKKERKL